MRHRAWLVGALVLLALSAWLMSRGDRPKKAAIPPKVAFPRRAKAEEQERNQKRLTLPPAPSTLEDAGVITRRDPVMVALPSTKGKSAVVFEASALRDSPIGKIWLDCMLARNDGERLDDFRSKYGIDPLEDIDRVAVSSEKVVVLSGAFEGARWEAFEASRRGYGDKGAIYESEGRAFGVWDNGLVLIGESAKDIEGAIDRLEDKAPSGPPLIPEWASYGDVYGVLSPGELAEMLPPEQREVADQLRRAVEQVELHVDASEDVAIVADVSGPNAEDVGDLGKSLGAALSLGRLKAQEEGDERLSELLDFARVSPHEGRFAMEMALPLEVIKTMGPCRKSRREGTGGGKGTEGADL